MTNPAVALSHLGRRVERALLVCRQARLAFPGAFMEFTGHPIGQDGLMVILKDDPVLRDGSGELNCCALAALVDAPFGGASDRQTGPRVRPATAHIALQLTGASTSGDLAVEGRFIAFSDRSRVRQSLVGATIRSGDTLVGHATAACVLQDLPEDRARVPWPWVPEGFRPDLQQTVAFDPAERMALDMCARAERSASDALPFIEHFWCGIPETGEGTASLRFTVTPHLGNRIGHVQGGLLLGAAMKVANAAASQHMRLSNMSAYFVSPGVGPAIDIQSNVIQRGRSLAIVQTRVVGASGKLVLHASSQHVLA